MDSIKELIKDNNLGHELTKGSWGLEKENNRVDKNGHLALTKHPKKLGDKLLHPYITTDFSESQVEIITPPAKSIDEAFYMLENLHDIVSENLDKNEFLWPSSMPPIIPEDDLIPIADYGDSPEANEKMEYRNFIAEKYGKHKQLICGIHYNFSFDDDFIQSLYKYSNNKNSYYEFKNSIYLKISRNLLRYQWLLTYLLGANVATHSSYRHCCEIEIHKKKEEYIFKDACSYRNSLCGYRNKKDFRVSFDSLEENLSDLNRLIDLGHLKGVNEYYSPVRLKNSKDKNTISALEKEGIEYIELRMIDLNPLTKVGIDKESLTLVHLILLECLLHPNSKYDEDEQVASILKQNEVSFYGHNLKDEYKTEGLSFFNSLKSDLNSLKIENKVYDKIINRAIKRLNKELPLYSEDVYKSVLKEGYINHHLNLAQLLKKESINSSYSLKGYEELELSTQILIKEALLKGLKVEILDLKENFISIKDGNKIEYIKQSTKTSLDSYSTALVMENKAITKKILKESSLSVPSGGIYTNFDQARNEYKRYSNKKTVIKPNNTNFGTGITILNLGFSIDDYISALNLAFKHDYTILIEEFFEGEEYRFTVIDGKVAGVLRRVPANITGDGNSTINQLIKIKNQDPLRGKGYKKPLEFLKLGDEEIFILKNLGFNKDSILPLGQTIYIRENSNISTGGDSLDFTDEMHESYKLEAIKAAKAVKANITGVDMMIKDINKPRTLDNSTIIELNFNPAIHIHCYPYRGKNRRLGKKVLDALGF